MSAVEFPPVTGSAPNFPVEAFGTRTFLPTVTFRTYSEPFTTKYGHPGIPYDQWAVTLNFAHTIPPAFQILPVCRFENFARVEFVEVCKRLDELCAKGSREDGWKGKRAFGRRDKEGYWVQEILRRFNEVERGRLIGRHVWPLKGKLLTVERVDMWIKLVLCKLVEQVRSKEAMEYWKEIKKDFGYYYLDDTGFYAQVHYAWAVENRLLDFGKMSLDDPETEFDEEDKVEVDDDVFDYKTATDGQDDDVMEGDDINLQGN